MMWRTAFLNCIGGRRRRKRPAAQVTVERLSCTSHAQVPRKGRLATQPRHPAPNATPARPAAMTEARAAQLQSATGVGQAEAMKDVSEDTPVVTTEAVKTAGAGRR
jgi:hypothetical protein